MSRYETNVVLYRLKKDRAFRDRFRANPGQALADADLFVTAARHIGLLSTREEETAHAMIVEMSASGSAMRAAMMEAGVNRTHSRP